MFNDPFKFIILIAVVAVALILMWGLGTFGVGKADSGKQSNKIMRYRIYAQAVAVALIAAAVYLRK
jgi:cytochrome oxidase assembly protein ShyY1